MRGANRPENEQNTPQRMTTAAGPASARVFQL